MKRITLIILAVVAILAGGISCQKANNIEKNPLSTVALSIIPDFSDGSVYSCSDEGSFFLRVSVKPENYIQKLSDNDAIVCKADFRRVMTKANEENPDFTVVGEITSASVEEGYITNYFKLAEDEVTILQESDYVVSFSIEDKDNIHVASTSYVPIDNPRGGQGGDNDLKYDDPVGTVGLLHGVEAMVVELPAITHGQKITDWTAPVDYPKRKVAIALKNVDAKKMVGDSSVVYFDFFDANKSSVNKLENGWHLPYIHELAAFSLLLSWDQDINSFKYEANNGQTLFIPWASRYWSCEKFDTHSTSSIAAWCMWSLGGSHLRVSHLPIDHPFSHIGCIRAFCLLEGDPYILKADSEAGDIVWVNEVEGLVVQLPALSEADAQAAFIGSKEFPAKKVVIATRNYGASTPDAYGEYASFKWNFPTVLRGWRVPSCEELWALTLMKDKEWKGNGWEWKIGNDKRSLFFPTAGMIHCDREGTVPEDTSFGAYMSNYYDPDNINPYYLALRLDANGFRIGRYDDTECVSIRLFYDLPRK